MKRRAKKPNDLRAEFNALRAEFRRIAVEYEEVHPLAAYDKTLSAVVRIEEQWEHAMRRIVTLEERLRRAHIEP